MQNSGFGYFCFEIDADDLAGVAIGWEGDFYRGDLLQVVSYLVEHVAGEVGFARGGTEEAELRGFADDQAEFAVGEIHFGAFFHTEVRHGEGFQRRWEARNRG